MFFAVLSSQSLFCNPFVPIRMEITISSSFFNDGNLIFFKKKRLGYLYRYTEPRIEDVIDEMIAILSDREEVIKKKEMEQAQAVINEIYRNGL